MDSYYEKKYLKYKAKYLKLKNQLAGKINVNAVSKEHQNSVKKYMEISGDKKDLYYAKKADNITVRQKDKQTNKWNESVNWENIKMFNEYEVVATLEKTGLIGTSKALVRGDVAKIDNDFIILNGSQTGDKINTSSSEHSKEVLDRKINRIKESIKKRVN